MSFIKKFFLFLNVITALCIVAGGVSIYVNPADAWIISFFGLLYPLFLLLNIFFIFFWIVVRLQYATISLLAIALSYPVLKTYFAFNFSNEEVKTSGTQIKIMSYNVRNFDLYNWSKNKNTMDKIMELIAAEDPDVACFQEFYNSDTGKFQTIKHLLNETGFKYYHFEKTAQKKNNRAWGIATFSKYPIINSGNEKFENAKLNSAMYCDLKIDSQIVRVINVHLQSIHLSAKDYEYLNEVSEDQNVEVAPTKAIASKFKSAFLNRANQALQIQNTIEKSKFPVIVCGDFNDTPASFCYHTIGSKLNDAFLCSGAGMGATYDGIPSIYRIDYLLTSPSISISDYNSIREKYSDHYPITCKISFQ